MPYRRLPNTDQARIKALKLAVQAAQEADYNEQVLSYKTLSEAQRFLMQFEGQVSQYQDKYTSRVSANRSYRKIYRNARMYISHFMRVLMMSIQRGEIKREYLLLYGLPEDCKSAPTLSTEEEILFWGKRVIEGETKRQAQGGFPIYNPAINKVKVHYDIFCENQLNHSFHHKTITRAHADLGEMRPTVDALILDIWNQVETHFENLLPYAKMCRCKQYGVIFYYRPGEKKLSIESDKELDRISKMQTTLQWSEGE